MPLFITAYSHVSVMHQLKTAKRGRGLNWQCHDCIIFVLKQYTWIIAVSKTFVHHEDLIPRIFLCHINLQETLMPGIFKMLYPMNFHSTLPWVESLLNVVNRMSLKIIYELLITLDKIWISI